MIYTLLTNKAMRTAYAAHAGQVDKCGTPYIFHPIHLAEQMPDEISVCAALLHDVAEDTDITLSELESEFPSAVIDVLKLLTHKDGIDYFDFSECLNDLVQTEHLRLTEEGRYAITPKGLKNSAICESSLPYSVRLRTDRNIEEYNKELLRQAQVQGKAIPRENGTYTVELKLSDDVDSLMQLELMVATEEMAKDLAERFRKDPEHLYARVLEALYEEQK